MDHHGAKDGISLSERANESGICSSELGTSHPNIFSSSEIIRACGIRIHLCPKIEEAPNRILHYLAFWPTNFVTLAVVHEVDRRVRGVDTDMDTDSRQNLSFGVANRRNG